MCVILWFFFFKQKTAYEMRISDWSSDVCSSDLIDVARGEAGLGEDRHGRERQRRLRDIIAGIGLQLGTKGGDLLLARGGADQHAIAARAVDLLDHQLGQAVETLAQMVGVRTAPRSEEQTSEPPSLMRKSYADL